MRTKKLAGNALAFALAMVAALALAFTACGDGTGGGDGTPTAADFTIGNLTQTAGSVTSVTITPKSGKSSGARTIYYNGSTTIPQTVGTYAVTFDVAATTGWNAVSGLSAGTLDVNNNQTPVAADYDIGNLTQTPGSVTAVTITPKSGKSSGARTIYYNGSTTIPQTAGSYTVTFNVAAASGWNAANDLSAGTLSIQTFVPEYALGDTGPGGGKIIYVSIEGFKVYQNATDTTGITCHYLEAITTRILGELSWANIGSAAYGNVRNTETAIGTGKRNTALILEMDATAPAAKACNDYTNNGKDDWFLPSKDELNKLYEYGFAAVTRSTWSSSQGSSYYERAWSQDMYGGSANYSSKSSTLIRVFPVRAF